MSRAAGGLDRHRRALRACRRCGHAADIAPIVSLARSPKMMLVGQAPGRVEADGGAPFSGRASELRIIRPRVIIPGGRLAIDVFLGPRPLDEVIGGAHQLHPEARFA